MGNLVTRNSWVFMPIGQLSAKSQMAQDSEKCAAFQFLKLGSMERTQADAPRQSQLIAARKAMVLEKEQAIEDDTSPPT